MNDEWREQWRWLNALRCTGAHTCTKSEMSLDKIIVCVFLRSCISDCNDKSLFIHSCDHYCLSEALKTDLLLTIHRLRIACAWRWRRILPFFFLFLVFGQLSYPTLEIVSHGSETSHKRWNSGSRWLLLSDARTTTTHVSAQHGTTIYLCKFISRRKSSSALDRVRLSLFDHVATISVT